MARALTIEEKVARAEGRTTAPMNADGSSPTRTRRGVFNGTEQKLRVSKEIPGYHLHILNDTPGRIDTALDGGYEFVSPEEVGGISDRVTALNTELSNNRVRYLVGTGEGGAPMYAYLMKIRQEWYDEDQEGLQHKVDGVDAAIRSGKNPTSGSSSDGFYSPRGTGISYKT